MIAEFYKDAEIFITGGTGVVGSAVIEKLLRSCDVKRIFVLMRSKKNQSLETRLEKLRNDRIFKKLRSLKPNELDKLAYAPGELALPNLGITPEYAKLMENVSVIFHCAATVRFDEPLRVALTINLRGTLQALKFAETLPMLKIFMHVSTFFSNPYLTYVESKMYKAPVDWKFCLKLLDENKNDDLVDALTRKLIMGFPNTYTFTKNITESMVNDFRQRLPVVIFRPSIVLFALRDPEPGYPPGVMGAPGLYAVKGAGILKTWVAGRDSFVDITPQDVCVKSMIYYGFRGAAQYETRSQLSEAPVYMFSSSEYLNSTFRQIFQFTDKWRIWHEDGALLKGFLLPGCTFTTSNTLYLFLVLTKQVLPAMLGDLILRGFGKKPLLMGVMRKLFVSLEVMKPFVFNTYRTSGVTDADALFKQTKNTEFDFEQDIIACRTDEGMVKLTVDMAFKIKEIIFKEGPETVPYARLLIQIKEFIYNAVRLYLAWRLISWFYNWFLNCVMTDL